MFNAPYATEYTTTGTPVFPDILGITNLYGASYYYAHEVGTDQVNSQAQLLLMHLLDLEIGILLKKKWVRQQEL